MTVQELHDTLDETLQRVERGERIVVLLDGQPTALLLAPSDPVAAWLGHAPDEPPAR